MSSGTPPIADDVELLRVYLAERDVACPQCKYNLRNLVGRRCPECGEALLLRVAAAEPRQAAPLAGLVILSAGAGLNALLLIYAMIETTTRGGGRGFGKFIAVNAVEFVVMGICVGVWLRSWRVIRRLGTARRWVLVAGCAALTLADVIFFAKLIR